MARLFTVMVLLCLAGSSSCAPPLRELDAAIPWSHGGDGFSDAPGAGACFFLDGFAFSQPGVGIDLTGDGAPDAALNNAFARELEYFNALFYNAIDSGQLLSMIEVAGLGSPYAGEDDAVTVKFYECQDADGDISNNHCLEPGCGHMLADPDHIVDGQTLYRTAPAPLQDHRVRGELTSTLYMKVTDHALPIGRTSFDLLVPDDLGVIADSIMGGAATAHGLDFVTLCEFFPDPCPPFIPANMTLAVTLRERGFQPDVDLDGDGLETFEIDPASYEVLSCRDGDGTPIDGAGCLHDARVADGYSLCFDLHGIPGQLSYTP